MFVGVFSPSFGGGKSGVQEGVGRLYGKPVTSEEYNRSRFFTMGMRETPGATEEYHEAVAKTAWERLAALKTAEKLGFRTSDREVGQRIRRDPRFAVNGAFNAQRYADIIRSQWRFQDSLSMFEEFLRQELTLQKLVDMLQSAVWISPFELNERLHSLTDEFTAQCVLLRPDTNAAPPAVSEQELRAYFSTNQEAFREPERVSVRYVSFPVSNFLAAVRVPESEVADHYTNNIDDYATTNNAEGRLAYRPLESVRSNILADLSARKALFDAKDESTRFAVALTPDRAGRAPSFEEVAARFGLAVHTTALFSAAETVKGLDAGEDFNRAAFRLDPADGESYFSDGVMGRDAVFVLAAREKKESFVPRFEDVADRVRPALREERRKAEFLGKTGELRDAIEARMRAGKTFEAALAESRMNVTTSFTFSAYTAAPGQIYEAEALLTDLIQMQEGEVSRPIEVAGGLVLAHVSARRPAEFAMFGLPRTQVLSALNRYRADITFADWRKYLLREADFQKTTPAQQREQQAPVEPLDF
jgi:tetratricopeptide (TPR) repeat protein